MRPFEILRAQLGVQGQNIRASISEAPSPSLTLPPLFASPPHYSPSQY